MKNRLFNLLIIVLAIFIGSSVNIMRVNAGTDKSSAICYYKVPPSSGYDLNDNYTLVISLKAGKDTVDGVTFDAVDYNEVYKAADIKYVDESLSGGKIFVSSLVRADFYDANGDFGCPQNLYYDTDLLPTKVTVKISNNPTADKNFLGVFDDTRSSVVIDEGNGGTEEPLPNTDQNKATCYYKPPNNSYPKDTHTLILDLKPGKDKIESITFQSSDCGPTCDEIYDTADIKFIDKATSRGINFISEITRSDFYDSNNKFTCPKDVVIQLGSLPTVKVFTLANSLNPNIDSSDLARTDIGKSLVNGKHLDLGDFNPVGGGEAIDCNDFDIGGINFVKGLFKLIMIFAPILVIIFGSIDFAKATLVSDDNALKKAGADFGKRAISAVLLIILPFIINLLITIAATAGIFGEVIPQVCL